MPCYYPITAYRSRMGRSPNGGWPIVFNRKEGYDDLKVIIPCGQCIGCRLEKSRQWAIRCVNESQMHEENCFITLTYRDEDIPENLSLVKKDLQEFYKRMRKTIKFRYFSSGEYGDLYGRPHYHSCIFGYRPDIGEMDTQMHPLGRCEICKDIKTKSKEIPLYHSKWIDEKWKKGHVIIGEVTFESAAYVARYVMKKMSGEKSKNHYGGRIPEFALMSRKPGIGATWYDKYKTDLYPRDKQIIRGGIQCKPAMYYDRKYDLENPRKMRILHYRREKNAKMMDEIERSWERLKTKETVKKIKIERLIKPL